ncbi:MAG: DUF4124 domain-containing protein [Rhodocyclaceae bacterium]|nr:DUF4124 domain-containing protein [Rhodocyclaceae bacterium]
MQATKFFLLAVLLGCAAQGLYADTYRWVDERGVVNYGDKPPKGVQSTAVDDSPNQIPAPKPRDAQAAPAAAAPAADAAPDYAGSRRASDDALAREQQRSEAEQQRRIDAWRARCQAERRVDCDQDPPPEAYSDGSGIIIIRPHLPAQPIPPFVVQPPPPPAATPRVVATPRRTNAARPAARDHQLDAAR